MWLTAPRMDSTHLPCVPQPGNTKGKEKAAVEDKDKDIEGGCNGKGAEEQDGDAVQSDEDGEGEEEVEEEDDVEEASESVGKGERATVSPMRSRN